MAVGDVVVEADPPASLQPQSREPSWDVRWAAEEDELADKRRHTIASTSRRHVAASLFSGPEFLASAVDEAYSDDGKPRRASAPARTSMDTLDDAQKKSLLQRIDEDHPMSRSRGANAALVTTCLKEGDRDDVLKSRKSSVYSITSTCTCSSSSCPSSPGSSREDSRRRSSSRPARLAIPLSETVLEGAAEHFDDCMTSGGAEHSASVVASSGSLRGQERLRLSPRKSAQEPVQCGEKEEELLWSWRREENTYQPLSGAGSEKCAPLPETDELHHYQVPPGGLESCLQSQLLSGDNQDPSLLPMGQPIATHPGSAQRAALLPSYGASPQPQIQHASGMQSATQHPMLSNVQATTPSPSSHQAPITAVPTNYALSQQHMTMPMHPHLSAQYAASQQQASPGNTAQLQLQVQLLQFQMQQMHLQQLHQMNPAAAVGGQPMPYQPCSNMQMRVPGYPPPFMPMFTGQAPPPPPPAQQMAASPPQQAGVSTKKHGGSSCVQASNSGCVQSYHSQVPTTSHQRPPRAAVAQDASLMDAKGGSIRHAVPPSGPFWGHLVSLAKDPKGSRQLQAQLPRMADQQLARAAEELAPHLYELSRHTFGNYLVSKLAAVPQMHAALTCALKSNVVDLLQHAQGSRVVQAALASLPAAAAAGLTSELDGHILECAMDTHGSWGVCIAFKHTKAPFILKQMSKHIYALSTQQHGCRVVQSVLQAASAAQLDLSLPVSAILEGEIEYLSMHPFGNYAVQVSLRHCDDRQRLQLLDSLLPRVLQLSTSKHGSNVAETLLMLADEAQMAQVSEQIFGDGAECRNSLQQLVEHPFGNYVLQTLLRRMSVEQRSIAAVAVRAVTTPSNYGRSVLARVGEEEEVGEEGGRRWI